MGLIAGLICLLVAFTIYGDEDLTDCTFENLQTAVANGGMITFFCDETIVFSSTLVISKNTTLDGDASSVVLQGRLDETDSPQRLFTVNPGITLTLRNLTLADSGDTNGGAIYNWGRLVLENVAFTNNLALGIDGTDGADGRDSDTEGHDGRNGTAGGQGLGGAIYNVGTVEAIECAFLTNGVAGGNGGDGGQGGNASSSAGDGGHAGIGGDAQGGAIYNLGTVSLTNCTFAFNTALAGSGGNGGLPGQGRFPGVQGRGARGGSGSGAALYSRGRSILDACTFFNNIAESGDSSDGGGNENGTGQDGSRGSDSLGGGVANLGTNIAINCTFSANEVRGGDGGNGGPGGVFGGDGGNGGHGWGGNYFNAGLATVTNCTFADGFSVGGTNGVQSSSPDPGEDGAPGQVRGDNIANSAGMFILKNSLLASPIPTTNSFRITNIVWATNIIFNVVGGTNAERRICVREIEIRSDGVTNLNELDCENFEITGSNLVAQTTINCITNVDTEIIVRPSKNAYGTIIDAGHNLSSDNTPSWTASTSRGSVNVLLGSFDNDDDPTYVYPLLRDSPAINAADPDSFPETDQRGVERPFGAAPDIGAFELEAYQVRGRVAEGLRGLSNIVVTVTGEEDDGGEIGLSKRTDQTGSFVFTLSPGVYTITPEDDGYVFDPPSEDEIPLGEDIEGVDFSAEAVFSIRGRITFGDEGIPDVEVTIGIQSTFTDAAGNYLFQGLLSGQYAVEPRSSTLTFAPPFRTVMLNANVTSIDFIASGLSSISGQVTRDGEGLTGVLVSVGPLTTTTTNGNYSFSGLPDGSYTVAPSLAGYSFEPLSLPVELSVGEAVSDANFEATPIFSLKGRVGQGSQGISGVTIKANDEFSVLTDTSGNYVFPMLPAGDYIVEPSISGYTFAPEFREVELTRNLTGINFSASKLFTISGRLTDGAAPLSNVEVRLGTIATAFTDASGFFAFLDLPAGTYSVTPATNGTTFNPAARSVRVGPDALDVNFTGSGIYSIRGVVTSTNDIGLADVVVRAGTKVALSAADGTYEIDNLAPGAYDVSAAMAPFAFIPDLQSVTISNDHVEGVNFTAGLRIAGRVIEGSAGVSNVTVTVADNVLTTDVDGRFGINLPSGTYTVQASRENFAFRPASQTVTIGPSQTEVEFFSVYTLEGQVCDGPCDAGNGLEGVAVHLGTNVVITDFNGRYSLSEVPGGTLTVTPTNGSASFNPSSRLVTVNNASVNGGFGANGPIIEIEEFRRVYFISGRVTEGTQGLSGIMLSIGNTNTITDASGQYSFSNLQAGTYVVVAPTNGVGFSPPGLTNTVPPSVTNANFIANPPMLTSIQQTNGATQVSAIGLPNRTYLIQFSMDFITNWTTISSNVANIDGVFGTHHTTNAPTGFYRVRTP